MSRSFLVVVYAFYSVSILSLFDSAQAKATTDPSEVAALNSIFQKWSVKPSDRWNISGEPCTGAAIDSTNFDDSGYNPAIKCNCSYNNGSTCHITHLKISYLDAIGVIPNELWTLTFLSNLNLGPNYLTGSLSASIGNLTQLQYLNFGANALSGQLPKELGRLTELLSLAFGQNNFSGPLPSEIGNLSKLEQLYIDSSGVSGEIPLTFANLQNLITVWASNTELTGSLPHFIGNWSKLTTLRLQGNSFEGPIPSTFSNLNSLNDLRISDLSNGSSSLAFVKDMKNLSILVLRNNQISDFIPSNIGEYQNLSHLDLSFNNLSGPIPDSLFNLSSLSSLFLGDNKLSGTLPAQKSDNLSNIDLSYNNLSGTFPSWVNQQNLQINLVSNNFLIESSNYGVLPTGLHCLQQNFPCNRGSGLYYNFSINSGGSQITSNNIVFEMDKAALGNASYFVTDKQRWAVSNVGYFMDATNTGYTSSVASQVPITLDSRLFQTARLSTGSLRYYGLGLQNGNYAVSLQFAETVFPDSPTWKSLGRRVFDIYIQGSLVSKDFDIRKEAGASFRVVLKEFRAQVSENYLEIHLFWAGKGTCCIPAQGTYGPSISALSVTPEFIPTVSNNSLKHKKNSTGLIVGIALGVGIISFLSLFAFYYLAQRRKNPHTSEDEDLHGIDAKTFSYAELNTATEDFSPSNLLGRGGFGPVYKGMLGDGRAVAVKQLSIASHHGKNQFVTEIATISSVQHRNLVKLYGCCIEGDKRLLVYEYLENKSLDQALFGRRHLDLNWKTRYDICFGVARGLAYLHEESRLRIVHRDVKASNILLDSNFSPKISDFGLAKLYDDKMSHITTGVAGTIGYLAPEYAMRGHLTEKVDVFGFGVVALEIVSGRPNSDSRLEEEKIYLVGWAWHLHESHREIELVDRRLYEFNEEEVKRVVGIALLCIQASPAQRPPMSRVVAMLSGDIEVGAVTSRPGYLTDWEFSDAESSLSANTLTKRRDNSHSSASMVTNSDNLSANAARMFDGIIEEPK